MVKFANLILVYGHFEMPFIVKGYNFDDIEMPQIGLVSKTFKVIFP